MIKFKIEKSKEPIDEKTYILWKHNITKYGEGWKGIFKGTKLECINKKNEILCKC